MGPNRSNSTRCTTTSADRQDRLCSSYRRADAVRQPPPLWCRSRRQPCAEPFGTAPFRRVWTGHIGAIDAHLSGPAKKHESSSPPPPGERVAPISRSNGWMTRKVGITYRGTVLSSNCNTEFCALSAEPASTETALGEYWYTGYATHSPPSSPTPVSASSLL
jgi:hypothetical protein